MTLSGGFAPIILTWTIGATGSKLAPGFYQMPCAVISLATQPPGYAISLFKLNSKFLRRRAG
ncbi:hypothetical protein [Cupriavidus sp. PET2-C1]